MVHHLRHLWVKKWSMHLHSNAKVLGPCSSTSSTFITGDINKGGNFLDSYGPAAEHPAQEF